MLAGIREILVISTPRDLPMIRALLGDGSDYGITLEYAEQAKPEGIAQAFHLGADFLAESPACLILGDNLFYGHDMVPMPNQASKIQKGRLRLWLSRSRSRTLRRGRVRFERQGPVTGRKAQKPEEQLGCDRTLFLRWLRRRSCPGTPTVRPW